MQIISPDKVFRGKNAWQRSLPEIVKISKSPLLLGRSLSTRSIRSLISKDLEALNLTVYNSELEFDCCEEDLTRIYILAREQKCDSIITAGGGKVLGWDIGPGNCLIDQAMKNITNGKKQFDNKGFLAKKGNPHVLKNTIKKFLNESYFKRPIPKSQTVENYDLRKFKFDPLEIKKLKDEDLISGLTEITFQSILRDLKKYCNKKYEIYFCGGGTKNNYLMDRFNELHIENLQFFKTSDLGIDPLDVEAMTFAWLAKKRLEKQKIKLTSVTGSKPCLMGEVIN